MAIRIIFLLFLIVASLYISAASINGRVTDIKTGELLVGCTVYIEELKKGTVTGFDGSYLLKDIPAGSYTLRCSYIGYEGREQKINIASEQVTITVDFALIPSFTDIDEIIVSGIYERNTERSARSTEKNAANIINVMSAKAIELSPDLNVANVIQRMSGVTMERNSSGEPQYAILRGMDKRYNYTLVNGVKIPSPDNKHRYVPLDIFPSELLDRVEVTKSLTSDMEGDASGGVVNMIMKDAPANFILHGNIALGYNSMFLGNDMVSYSMSDILYRSPREKFGKEYRATMDDFRNASGKFSYGQALPNGMAGLTLGNRYAQNRLGIILAANFQNFYKTNTSLFYENEMIQTEKTVRLTNERLREYFENQMQYGVHNKIDFRLNNRNKIEWYNAFISARNAQIRESNSINFKLNYDPANGFEDRSYQTRIRSQFQSLITSTLQGKHKASDEFSFDWSAIYSKASNRLPEQTHINIDNLIQNFNDNIYVDADGSTRRWEHNSDRDYSALLNLKYETELWSSKLTLKGGGLYRDKQRKNDYVNYRFKPLNGSQRYGIDYTTLDEIKWTLYTPAGSVGPLVYDASEKIGAAYLNGSVLADKVFVSTGVRAEYTNQGYFMYFPDAGSSPEGEQTYIDILPSVQVKYMPGEKINWKASYFRSINRPGFFEIVPYQIVNEEYNEFGNKDLKRAQIDNFDIRWEYFPNQTEQIMVGFFLKNLKNPIEYAYFTTNYRQYGYGPVNLGNARNLGAEVDFLKYLRNFGIKANYTFTHSQIITPKAYFGMDESGSYKRMFEDQKRPLVGQAMHVANLSLLYKNTRNGWDAQLASSYTGEKINIASHYLNSDYWQAPIFQMDASVDKDFKNGLSVFAKMTNLANSKRREYIKTSNPYNQKFPVPEYYKKYTLIRDENFGRTILMGIRYKL